MNTKAGGQKIRETMIKKYGSEEAWKEFMRSIGSRGGKNGTTGGFYANRELARTAGALGGKVSKRTKKILAPQPVDYIPEPPKRRFLFWSF